MHKRRIGVVNTFPIRWVEDQVIELSSLSTKIIWMDPRHQPLCTWLFEETPVVSCSSKPVRGEELVVHLSDDGKPWNPIYIPQGNA